MYEASDVGGFVRLILEAARQPTCAEVTLIAHGRSGALVAAAGDVFVKFAPKELQDNIDLLSREIAVAHWLDGRVPTAPLLWSGAFDGGLALVTGRAPGEAVSHVSPDQAPAALTATLQALAALHALDPAGCPFDMSLDARFALAERHVADGLVDEDDFDDERAGWTAVQALDHARATRPASERLVLTHGDASLPNFVWTPGRPVALLDLGRFGLADPWQDLALFLRSAKFNFPGLDAAALLREVYPLAQVDEAACAFYRLMDEFF